MMLQPLKGPEFLRQVFRTILTIVRPQQDSEEIDNAVTELVSSCGFSATVDPRMIWLAAQEVERYCDSQGQRMVFQPYVPKSLQMFRLRDPISTLAWMAIELTRLEPCPATARPTAEHIGECPLHYDWLMMVGVAPILQVLENQTPYVHALASQLDVFASSHVGVATAMIFAQREQS